MILGAAVAKLRGRPVILPNHNQLTNHSTGHQAFVLGDHGVFRFHTDFHGDDYANISFHAPDIGHIPFHLSVRAREQLIVYNDTRTDGTWRAERSIAQDLPPSGTEITITLTPKSVNVHTNGNEVFRMRPWRFWRRSGLRGLDQITTFTTQGGLRISEIFPQAPQDGQLVLDTRLQLRPPADPGKTAKDYVLTARTAPVLFLCNGSGRR